MQVFVDNTANQSAGGFLEGKTVDVVNLHELLQLATLLAFADRLVVDSYGDDVVVLATPTSEVRARLLGLGVTPETLELNRVDDTTFVATCESAAKRCADDLELAFNPRAETLPGLYPSGLRTAIISTQVEIIRRLLTPGMSDSELNEHREQALSSKKLGAAAFMLCSCESLRHAASRQMSRWPRSDGTLIQLDMFCRAYFNDSLASSYQARYTPAVSRAHLLRKDNAFLVSHLAGVVDQAVRKLRDVPLGVPSIAGYLILKAKGDPAALISEAVRLRDKTQDLRHWLSSKTDALDLHDSGSKYEANKVIRELSTLLEKELGLVAAPRLRDALELSFVLGLPAPNLSGTDLLDWLEYRWKKRKVIVLTELSKSLAFADDVAMYYQRLLRTSSGPGT